MCKAALKRTGRPRVGRVAAAGAADARSKSDHSVRSAGLRRSACAAPRPRVSAYSAVAREDATRPQRGRRIGRGRGWVSSTRKATSSSGRMVRPHYRFCRLVVQQGPAQPVCLPSLSGSQASTTSNFPAGAAPRSCWSARRSISRFSNAKDSPRWMWVQACPRSAPTPRMLFRSAGPRLLRRGRPLTAYILSCRRTAQRASAYPQTPSVS